jgi:acyl-CoA thioester hydrolase
MTDPWWDFPNPFVISFEVTPDLVDGLGHMNNVAYLAMVEKIAWAHSEALGISLEDFRRLNRAMVARRHELDYLSAGKPGERLVLGTWLVENDEKLTIRRRYQMVRPDDGKTLLRASTHWVCVDFLSGAPRRMPPEFVAAYRPIVMPSS